MCWHTQWSTFKSSAFMIWNSSTGIPSPSLALFAVMLPKIHFILLSRMPDSRWVITPLWLSASRRSSLNSSPVYSCHLFLTSSASVRTIHFLSFILPIFALNGPLVSLIFLKISSLFHSFVFLYFFALVTEEEFPISPWYYLELYNQVGVSFLFSCAFSISSFLSYL